MLFVAMLIGHGDGTEKGFSQQAIPDAVFERMQGKSFPVGCKDKQKRFTLFTYKAL